MMMIHTVIYKDKQKSDSDRSLSFQPLPLSPFSRSLSLSVDRRLSFPSNKQWQLLCSSCRQIHPPPTTTCRVPKRSSLAMRTPVPNRCRGSREPSDRPTRHRHPTSSGGEGSAWRSSSDSVYKTDGRKGRKYRSCRSPPPGSSSQIPQTSTFRPHSTWTLLIRRRRMACRDIA